VEPTTEVTSSPTPDGGVGAGGLQNDGDGGALPITGSANTEQLLLLGLGLVVLGAGLVLSFRQASSRR
jgi:LPXTG-motif cell wall-anchored protein